MAKGLEKVDGLSGRALNVLVFKKALPPIFELIRSALVLEIVYFLVQEVPRAILVVRGVRFVEPGTEVDHWVQLMIVHQIRLEFSVKISIKNRA